MRTWLAASVLSTLMVGPLVAQATEDTTRIQVVPVAGSVSMLVGRGGNIGVAVGDDAVFLVDDQFAPLTQKIIDAVKTITDKPIKFLLNTHWHGDHTGGNENFGKAGVVIVAHDNVRQRMSVEQFLARFNQKVPPAPRQALPVITFADMVTFHINDDDIHAVHVANAHTDGDVVVHWTKSNVMHLGDTFFNGGYPFIDLGSGGSIDGVIRAVTTALGYANDGTKIIPGHGPLGTKADLTAYRDMLVGIRGAVQRLIAQRKTKEQIIAAKPLAKWDDKWGKGFIKPDDMVTTIYESLTTKKPAKGAPAGGAGHH
jgi:glyoxylase-like metal-dependent hydrolase (beta-lactamase superfamily II)